jgi:hypothetical protein
MKPSSLARLLVVVLGAVTALLVRQEYRLTYARPKRSMRV